MEPWIDHVEAAGKRNRAVDHHNLAVQSQVNPHKQAAQQAHRQGFDHFNAAPAHFHGETAAQKRGAANGINQYTTTHPAGFGANQGARESHPLTLPAGQLPRVGRP